MKKYAPILFAAGFCSSVPAAPVPINAGSLVYTQNFDVLASSPNNDASPVTWADDDTIPGWWKYRAGQTGVPLGLAGAADPYYVSDGSAAPNTAPLVHGFYSLGALDSTERAMGLCPTTPQGEQSAIVVFQNTGATPLKLSNVKFNSELYRTNTTANVRDSLFVWWKTAADLNGILTFTTAPTSTNPAVFVAGSTTTGPTSDYITGWTYLPEFTSTSLTPVAATQSNPPDTKAFNAAPAAGDVLVEPGQFLALRWSNINDGGTDAIQGFDDVELTFATSSGCIVDTIVSGVARLPGADPNSAADDSVQFTINATAVAGSPGGWKVPAGGLAGGTTGAYGVPVTFTAPVTAFGATGSAALRVEDTADSGCFKVVNVTAPPFIQKVTAASSPTITFTPSAVGSATFVPPPADQSELGWTGGNAGDITVSNVQKQPDSGAFTGTLKYWHLTTANTTFTTDPVDVGDISGKALDGKIELAFYSTSTTELDDNDVVFGRLEVAVDGDFNNTTAGNILTEVFMDISGLGAPATFSQSIPAADPYIELNTVGYPAADFTFHALTKTVLIPVNSPNARAHIVVGSGAGITNTEHILLDNIRLSLSTASGDSDGDGIPDDYETANGLNPGSSADRDTDLDGDGQSNYLEYVAGTQANNPASTFRIIDQSISATNEISLTWNSVAGKKYQAQISTDLGSANAWTAIPGTITASGATTSVPPGIIIPAGNLRYFIRVIVVP